MNNHSRSASAEEDALILEKLCRTLTDELLRRMDMLRLVLARGREVRWYEVGTAQVIEVEEEGVLFIELGSGKMSRYDTLASVLATHGGEELRVRRVLPGKIARGRLASLTQTLSETERSMLYYMRLGLTNRQIGQRMGLAPSTVKNRLSDVRHRFKCSSRYEMSMIYDRLMRDLPSAIGPGEGQ